jgi:rhamnosyltransferase
MKPVCSIIIRAYNEERYLARLLTGISHQTLAPVQTILVDSGSTDQTLQVASRFPIQVVKIKPKEFSFGRSLNLGITQADAAYIVIASAHVYPVYPDWLERLVAPLTDPQIALCYGKQRGIEESHFSEQQIFRHWYSDVSSANQPHPFCNNANVAIRRSFWEQHPYDETLPALEDLAWARWAQGQGFRISYVAEAEIIHVHHETWHGVYNRYRREAMAFKTIFPQEKFDFRDMLRLFFTNSFSDLHAAIKKKIFSKNILQILLFRWNQFTGTYRGYQQSGQLTLNLKQAFYYPKTDISNSETRHRHVNPIPYHDLGPDGDKMDGN